MRCSGAPFEESLPFHLLYAREAVDLNPNSQLKKPSAFRRERKVAAQMVDCPETVVGKHAEVVSPSLKPVAQDVSGVPAAQGLDGGMSTFSSFV